MDLTRETLKQAACGAIDDATDKLEGVSRSLWDNPELLFEEHFAHQMLTDVLDEHGFPLERSFVLDTAFRSIYGSPLNKTLPNIAVLCEYDALPDIGHACGHNLIAEVGVAAAIGIKAAIDTARNAGKDLGTLTVLGTPAEEGGCGKAILIDAGAFKTVDAAMMAHPGPSDILRPICLAITTCSLKYHGKASHAAAFPWEGVNALDAAIMAYNNVSVLRQQMKPSWRVHGVITNGGTKPNIIPEEASMEYYIRTPETEELLVLKDKITRCFKAAATATGCQVEISWDEQIHNHLISNNTLASLYQRNVRTDVKDKRPTVGGSTDMGNVSHVVPSIHPFFYIGELAYNHTRNFTHVAGKPEAQPYTLAVAKQLAMTAIDVYWQPELVAQMKAELQQELSKAME